MMNYCRMGPLVPIINITYSCSPALKPLYLDEEKEEGQNPFNANTNL